MVSFFSRLSKRRKRVLFGVCSLVPPALLYAWQWYTANDPQVWPAFAFAICAVGFALLYWRDDVC